MQSYKHPIYNWFVFIRIIFKIMLVLTLHKTVAEAPFANRNADILTRSMININAVCDNLRHCDAVHEISVRLNLHNLHESTLHLKTYQRVRYVGNEINLTNTLLKSFTNLDNILSRKFSRFSIIFDIYLISTTEWSRTLQVMQTSGYLFTDNSLFIVIQNKGQDDLYSYAKSHVDPSFIYAPLVFVSPHIPNSAFIYCYFCQVTKLIAVENHLTYIWKSHILYNKKLFKPDKVYQMVPHIMRDNCISDVLYEFKHCDHGSPVVNLYLNTYNASHQYSDVTLDQTYSDEDQINLKRGIYTVLTTSSRIMEREIIGNFVQNNGILFMLEHYKRDLMYIEFARRGGFEGEWSIFFLPFEFEVWIFLVFAYVILTGLGFLGMKGKRRSVKILLPKMIWLFLSIFYSCIMGVSEFKKVSKKLVKLICLTSLLSVVLVNYYLGTFTSMSISKPPDRRITTLKQLVNEGYVHTLDWCLVNNLLYFSTFFQIFAG